MVVDLQPKEDYKFMFTLSFLIKICMFFIIFFCGCVIVSRNPAHSAFSLVIVFLLNAFVLFLINIKFLGFTLIILYAGAVSILFLFIIFTMNLKEKDQDLNILNYFIIYVTTLKLFLVVIEDKSFYFNKLNSFFFYSKNTFTHLILQESNTSDLFTISWLFYQEYVVLFIYIGIILFIAMFAVIVLIIPFLSNGEKMDYYYLNFNSDNNILSQLEYDSLVQSASKSDQASGDVLNNSSNHDVDLAICIKDMEYDIFDLDTQNSFEYNYDYTYDIGVREKKNSSLDMENFVAESKESSMDGLLILIPRDKIDRDNYFGVKNKSKQKL